MFEGDPLRDPVCKFFVQYLCPLRDAIVFRFSCVSSNFVMQIPREVQRKHQMGPARAVRLSVHPDGSAPVCRLRAFRQEDSAKIF